MIPLHVHSNYSMLKDEAVGGWWSGPASYGVSAGTDTRGAVWAVPFYRAARAAGIKPIIGVFLEHTVLLARDREGYAQLCRLVTAYHLEEAFDLAARLLECGRVFVLADDAERIRRLHRNGLNPLVALTHHGDAVSRYRATRLHDLAAELGLRCVAVNPVYFLQPEEYRVHRVLSAIRCNATVDTLETGDAADAACWFRPPEEMRRLYVVGPTRCAMRNGWRRNRPTALGRPLFPGWNARRRAVLHLWKLAFEGKT